MSNDNSYILTSPTTSTTTKTTSPIMTTASSFNLDSFCNLSKMYKTYISNPYYDDLPKDRSGIINDLRKSRVPYEYTPSSMPRSYKFTCSDHEKLSADKILKNL